MKQLLVLLRHDEGSLVPASPYYPSFPAVPGAPISSASPFQAVIDEVAEVLRSPVSSSADKTALIWSGLRWDLQALQSNAVKQALQFAAVQDSDATVRMSAVAALLVQNEISILPLAERALSEPGPGLADDMRQNLSSAISEGIKGDAAVPALIRLLSNPDVRVRRSAAMALRNTRTNKAGRGLALALRDSDDKVKYYAVIGLAEIADQKDWRPSEEMFRANEDRYVQHWESWRSPSPQ